MGSSRAGKTGNRSLTAYVSSRSARTRDHFAHHNFAGFAWPRQLGATALRPCYLLSRVSRVRSSPPLIQSHLAASHRIRWEGRYMVAEMRAPLVCCLGATALVGCGSISSASTAPSGLVEPGTLVF